MTKHERRRQIGFGLLAIVGFFVLAGIGHLLVGHYQDQTLRTVAAVVSPDHHPAKMGDVHLVDLDGDSLRARDLRTHTVSGHVVNAGQYDTIHPHGRAERVYYHEYAGKMYALTQPQKTVLSVAPAMMWLSIFLYWGSVVAALVWRRRRMIAFAQEVEAMANSVEQAAAGEAAQNLLLTPNARLYPLALAVGRLRQTLDHSRRQSDERRARFQLLMANLPQGVMLINRERQVMMHNPALAEILGVPVSTAPHPYVTNIKNAALVDMIETVLKTGKTQRTELTIAGTQRAVDATVLGIAAAEGKQALVILYDLTYLRTVEQAQQDFVANVSHELKTPVTAISGFAETLLAGAADDPATRTRFLDIILRESQRLTQLITDILTLQRGAANRHVETLNVAQVVAGVVTNLSAPIKARRLTVTTDIAPELAVAVDREAFLQIVRNLVDNAAFYNQDDGTITVRAMRVDNGLRLSVTDTGVGIPDAAQARIFERFYRVDKARSRHNGGTGLGLAIVAEAVHRLGGEIAVASQMGMGSTFTVTLPVTFT